MTIFEILGLVSINNKEANKSLDEVNKKAENVSKELAKKFESIGKGFTKAGETMTKIGSKITKTVTLPLVGIGVAAGKTAIDFVKLKESSMGVFEKMLGGSSAAENMYQSLLKVAKASTYSQEAFLTAGKTLVGMGTSAQDTTKYLQAITDAVAGFGGSSTDIESLASVFGKVSAKGKVLTDDLNMLSERGVNGLQILAAHYNKTTDEMQEMVSKGMVPAKEGLDILCDGMENGYTYAGQFHQGLSGMAKQLKGGTLTGALDGLKSSFRNFSTELVGAFDNKQYMIDLVNAFGTALGHLPKVLSGITDAIAPTLQKVSRLLNKFNEFAETKEGQESLKKIGDLILKLAVVGPTLLALGKLSSKIGDTINKINKYKDKFNNIFGKVTGSIKKWKDDVKTYFGLGVSYIKDGLKDSKEMFKEFGNVLKGIGGVVFSPIINAFNNIKGKLVNFATTIKDKVTNKFTSMKDNLIDKFNDIKNGITNKISPIKDSIVNKFNSIKDGVIKKIIPMKDSIASHFGNIKNNISNVVGKISNSVSSKFGKVTQFLTSKFSEISQKVSGPFSKALEKGKSALGNFGKGFGAIGKGFGVAMKGVGLLSVGLIGISALATASGTDISKVADNMVQKVKNFANNLPNAVNQIVSQIQQKLPQIVQMIPQLVTSITQALQTIVTVLPQMLPPLIRGFVQLITGLVQMLPTIIPILVSGATQLFMGIIQCLPQILPPLVQGFIVLVNTICQMLPTLMPVLIQGAIQLFMAIVNAIDKIIPPLIAAIPVVVQALIDSFPVLIPALMEGAVQLFIAIVKAIPQIIQMLIKYGPKIIKGLIDGMKNGLSSLGGAVLDIGKNLVKGLWNGIKNTKDWLLNKLKSFGKSVVNGIKKVFGIHSPSTIFRDEIGKNLALGLGIGFTDEMEHIRDDMQDAVPNNFDTNLETNLSSIRKIVDETPNNDYKTINPIKTIVKTNSIIDIFRENKNNGSVTLEARIDTLIEILLQYLPLLTKRQLRLDTGALVGELVAPLDKEFGDLSDKKGRGR